MEWNGMDGWNGTADGLRRAPPVTRAHAVRKSPHSQPTTMSAEDETTNATTPRLYVGNIPWSATERELRDLFADAPGVRRVEIPTGRQGRSRGYGLVEFDTAEEAAAAVSRVDGACVGTRRRTNARRTRRAIDRWMGFDSIVILAARSPQ